MLSAAHSKTLFHCLLQYFIVGYSVLKFKSLGLSSTSQLSCIMPKRIIKQLHRMKSTVEWCCHDHIYCMYYHYYYSSYYLYYFQARRVNIKDYCRINIKNDLSLKLLNCTLVILFLNMYVISYGPVCHTQIKRGSPIVDPTVELQSRKTEVVLITL